MLELKKDYTIALVTHNMQQATRVADITAFFGVDISKGGRTGYLVEMGETEQIFAAPTRAAHAGIHPRRVQLASLARMPVGLATMSVSASQPSDYRRNALARVVVRSDVRTNCLVCEVSLKGAGAPSHRCSTRNGSRPIGSAAPSVSISYDAVGSGEGIARFTAAPSTSRAAMCSMSDCRNGQGPNGVVIGADHRRHDRARLQPPRRERRQPQASARRLRRHLRRQDQATGMTRACATPIRA